MHRGGDGIIARRIHLWRVKSIGDGTRLENERAMSLGGSTPSLSAGRLVERSLYKRAWSNIPNTVCAICNKSIYRRPSQVLQGKVYYSQDCYGKSCTKLVACAICGSRYKSSLNKKTCSRACANKLRIGSNYKNGRPTKDRVKTNRLLKTRLVSCVDLIVNAVILQM